MQGTIQVSELEPASGWYWPVRLPLAHHVSHACFIGPTADRQMERTAMDARFEPNAAGQQETLNQRRSKRLGHSILLTGQRKLAPLCPSDTLR